MMANTTSTENTVKPAGFVHVDLDGIWTLSGVYGFAERDLFDNDVVFAAGVDRLLSLFGEMDINATFFIVGRDLESAAKAEVIRRIAAAGHELANHTYRHRLDLEVLDDVALQSEIERTSHAILAGAGTLPIGFRAPGYGAGPRTLDACTRAGLRYDGSCLPTAWGGVLRKLAGGLRRKVQREEHLAIKEIPGASLQYGGLSLRGGAFAPEAWRGETGSLLRLPLAVSPVLRLPLHASLGMMMGSEAVRGGLKRLARKGWPLTYLIHGLDVIGREDLRGMLPQALLRQKSFAMATADKLEFLNGVLNQLKASTALSTTEQWLKQAGADRWLTK